MSIRKGLLTGERRREREAYFVPTKPWARPFLNVILVCKSSGSRPTSLFHCLKRRESISTLEINRAGDKREPLAPGDHSDANATSWSHGERLGIAFGRKCQNKHVSIYIPPRTCYLPQQQSQDFHLRSASENENKMFQILRDVSWDDRKP